MAKQRSNQVQTFLTRLATESELLLEFIKYPDRVLKAHNIRDKTTREQIKNLLALEVAKRLVAYNVGFVHW